jgi:hypothetical protein
MCAPLTSHSVLVNGSVSVGWFIGRLPVPRERVRIEPLQVGRG